jgi:hypothetical protein
MDIRRLAVLALAIALPGIAAADIEPDPKLGQLVYYHTASGKLQACHVADIGVGVLTVDLSCLRQPPTTKAKPRLGIAHGCEVGRYRFPDEECIGDAPQPTRAPRPRAGTAEEGRRE